MVLLATRPAPADTIRLRESAASAGPVTLARVADLSGPKIERWGGMVLARFHGERETVTVAMADVRRRLDERGVNWGLVSLSGFQQCRVQRVKSKPSAKDRSEAAASSETGESHGSDERSGSELRDRVESLLTRRAGVERSKLKIHFDRTDVRRLAVAAANSRYELKPRGRGSLGRVLVTIHRYENGSIADRFTVTADVRRRMVALVATDQIGRGDALTKDNVARREVLIDEERDTHGLKVISRVLDRKAASVLSGGEVIQAEDIRSPTLVERGEMVTVRCLSGPLVVRTVARAAEDGRKDQTIRLRNEGSRETFRAIVTGRNRAKVQWKP